MPSEISVHITVKDANGSNADVRVSDSIQVGQYIPERINVVAAEAAALANWKLVLGPDPIHRDRRR